MKSYREIADSVFARREQYVIAQRKKKQLVTRVTASVGSVALVSLASFALFKSDAFRETPPISDGGATTTTTHIPTEGEDTTTTTVNTTVPAPTTDGGVVAPTTTVTTVAPTTTAKPTTGKTDPSKPTTTSGTKDKLLITGDKLDEHCIVGEEAGVYKHGTISPLLQEAMEQYKDTDAVYAVIVGIRYKVDYIDARNALLESEEMIKLAEQRDLAYEEWKMLDEVRKANIGNEEVITTEFIEKIDSAKETYRSLRREYEKKVSDLEDAYRDAGLEKAVALLSEFSDIDLIPIKDRLKPDMDWSEEFPIRCVMAMSQSDDYAYVAVLSADEIVELSERIGSMYWLDSYDEDYYIAGMLDE